MSRTRYPEPSPALILSAHLAARGMRAHHAATLAETLRRYGRRADALAVRYCNGHVESDAYERATDKLGARVAATLAEYRALECYADRDPLADVVACVGGDPRGYCLKLRGLPGNTWGGDSEGFGIS